MLDSYPFAKSHKRGIIGQGIHLNTCHSLYPKNVTKKSDSFVSSSTPSFSATRYWKSTYDEKSRTWTYNYQPFQTSALPVELSSQIMVGRVGIEPTRQGFSVLCSTYWAIFPNVTISKNGTAASSSIWKLDSRSFGQCQWHVSQLVVPLGLEPRVNRLWGGGFTIKLRNHLYGLFMYWRSRQPPKCHTGHLSLLVPGTGLEPVRVAARDFKSLASAYSATPAFVKTRLAFYYYAQ